MHPEQACIALRAHEHREAFFPLDADFSFRVTLQQPKLLCSSQLGETCPCLSRCRRQRERQEEHSVQALRFFNAFSAALATVVASGRSGTISLSDKHA